MLSNPMHASSSWKWGRQLLRGAPLHHTPRAGAGAVIRPLVPSSSNTSQSYHHSPSILSSSISRSKVRHYTTTTTMAPPQIYTDETPSDVKDAKGLHLITMNTPNGQAVQIMLEELKDTYGIEWTTTLINIMTNEQKKDWFLRLDPNGRIPVLVDNTLEKPFPVMETSAEMFYLLKKWDKNDKFGFKDDLERNQCMQWTFFWHGSGAPYQGQVNHFSRAAPEKIEYAINRFKNETLRVFGVLEIQLSGKYVGDGEPREYLAGNGKGKYSVADMKTWPWVKGWERTGFTKEEIDKFPNLLKWIDRIAERPAVQRGIGEAYTQK